MFQIDIDDSAERRIAELAALTEQIVEEGLEVVAHYLMKQRQVWLTGLQNNQSALLLAAGTPTYLRHHLVGMFVSPKVRLVQHAVGIEDAYHRDAVEVEPLGDHLRSNEDVGAPGGEVADDTLVGMTGARGVKVHSSHTSLRKQVANAVFNFLRAKAACL